MGMKQTLKILTYVVFTVGLWLPTTSLAQQQEPPRPESQQDSARKNPDEKAAELANKGPAATEQSGVKEMGRATPLPAALGPLRLGLVYLRSVEFFQVLGTSSSDRSGKQSTVASIFQGTFAFDKELRSSRIALQYRPNVLVSNGKVYNNLASHDVQFDSYYKYQINPRWSMNLSEGLAYRSTRSQFADSYLAIDAVSGISVQNNFLEGPFRALSSSTSLFFGHSLSPRTSLTFGPRLDFAYSSGGFQQNAPITSPTFGADASLSHALSPTQSTGISYSYQRISPSRTFAQTTYQTVTGNYSQQLAQSWRTSFSVGASATTLQGMRQWSGVGNFSLSKSFQKSALALTYSRGHAFSGYINNGETQRADATYIFTLMRRLGTQVGGGYEYTASTLAAPGLPKVKVSGTYQTARLNYPIFPSLNWFVSYTHRKQISDDLQVFPGNRNFVVSGITWSPGTRAY